MDSYEKMWAAFWLSAGIVVTIALFTVTGCVKEENKLAEQVKIECIKKGGDWLPFESRQGSGCVFK